MTETQALLDAIHSGAGWYAVAAASATLAVRMLRQQAVQQLLPRRLQWGRLPGAVRLLVVGGASALSTLAASLTAGHPLSAAAMAALPVLLAAVTGHRVTRAVGHAHTKAAVKRGIDYEPGTIRTALDVVLPVDRQTLADRDADLARAIATEPDATPSQ